MDRQPVRSFLREREPLLPHKKVVDVLSFSEFGNVGHYTPRGRYTKMGRYSENTFWDDMVREYAQAPLPPVPTGVRPEEAIEVMAGSSWARGLAEGVCGPRYVGLLPGTADFDRCVYNVSHKVAARALRMEWTAPPAPTPAARPRRGR